ncbi:MAG: hypothetical protein WC222_09495 [Parachlamydiales bacterium]|jgi:hypothetical protein
MTQFLNYTQIASFAGGFGFGYQIATAHNNEKTVRQGNDYWGAGWHISSLMNLVALDALNVISRCNISLVAKAPMVLTVALSKFILSIGINLGSYVQGSEESQSSTFFHLIYKYNREMIGEEKYAIVSKFSKYVVKKLSDDFIIAEIALCAFKLYLGFYFEAAGALMMISVNVLEQNDKLPQSVSIFMGRYLPALSAVALILTPNAVFLRLLGVLLLANEVAMPVLNLVKYPLDRWIQKRNADIELQYPPLEELEGKPTLSKGILDLSLIQSLEANDPRLLVNPTHINSTMNTDLRTDHIDIRKDLTRHFAQFLVLEEGVEPSPITVSTLVAMKGRILDEVKGRELLNEIRMGKFPELREALGKVTTFKDYLNLPPNYYIKEENTASNKNWKRVLKLWKEEKYAHWDLKNQENIKLLKNQLLEEGEDFIKKNWRLAEVQAIIGNEAVHTFQAKKIRDPNNQVLVKRNLENWIACLTSLNFITRKDLQNLDDTEKASFIESKKVELFQTRKGKEILYSAWNSEDESVKAPLQIVIEDLEEQEAFRFHEKDPSNYLDWIPIIQQFAKAQMNKLVSDLSGDTKAPGNMSKFDETIDKAKQIIAYLDLLDSKITQSESLEEKDRYKQRKDEIIIPLFCEGGDYCVTGIEAAIENCFSNLFIEKETPVTSLQTRIIHMLFQQRKGVNQAIYSEVRKLSPSNILNTVASNLLPSVKKDGNIDLHDYNTAMSLIGPDTGTSSTSLTTDQTVQINPIKVLAARIFLPQYRYAFWSAKSAIHIEGSKQYISFSKDLLEGITKLVEELKPSMTVIKEVFEKTIVISDLTGGDLLNNSILSKIQFCALIAFKALKIVFIVTKEILYNFRSYFDLLNRILFIGLEAIFNSANLRYTSDKILAEVTDAMHTYYTPQHYSDWWKEFIQSKIDANELEKDFSLSDANLFLEDGNGKPNPKYLALMLMEMGILKFNSASKEITSEKLYFPMEEGSVAEWAQPLIHGVGRDNVVTTVENIVSKIPKMSSSSKEIANFIIPQAVPVDPRSYSPSTGLAD